LLREDFLLAVTTEEWAIRQNNGTPGEEVVKDTSVRPTTIIQLKKRHRSLCIVAISHQQPGLAMWLPNKAIVSKS
jgi:hypothetical protein